MLTESRLSISDSANPKNVYIFTDGEWVYVGIELYGKMDENRNYVLNIAYRENGEEEMAFNIKYAPGVEFISFRSVKTDDKYNIVEKYETYGAYKNNVIEIVSKCFSDAKDCNFVSFLVTYPSEKIFEYTKVVFKEKKLSTVIPFVKFNFSFKEPSSEFSGLDFNETVHQLDTPEKLVNYMKKYFKYVYHEGCIAYSPEEFFRIRKGDCKDFAVFSSYVLKLHGYDTKMIAFKFRKDGTVDGHVITVYKVDGGKLRYISFTDIYGDFSTTDEILKNEMKRIGADEILGYRILEPGNIDTCVK